MPLRFTLRQLEYLTAVEESGSIALAAERLNVSSPSISAAVQHLEREFGVTLFVRRHAQGLSPTVDGRRIIQQARAALAAAGRLSDVAHETARTLRGPLSVGALLTFAQVLMPRLRRTFAELHPGIEIRQSEWDQFGLFEGLRSARLDVALGYDIELPPDLAFDPLVKLPPYVIMPKGHPLARLRGVTLEALAEHPMVLLDLPLSADYFLSLFAAKNLRPIIVERTRDMAMMRGLVGQGFGYALANIPPQSDRAPDGETLRFAPVVGDPRALALGALSPRGAPPLRVQAFIEHCRREITPRTVVGLREDDGSAAVG